MKTKESEHKRLDDQLLSLMTHVQAFLKGRLTLDQLGEAEERAEIFRTNQVINYDEVAERVNAAQLEQENAELRKDKERLDWLLQSRYRGELETREAIDKAFDAGFELEDDE